MWARFCICLVFLAFLAVDPVTTECGLVPADMDCSAVIWQSLFSRINKIVNETSGLSESQNALTKTLLELIERQEKQETKLSEFIEKSDKRQEEQETKLSEFIEKSDKRHEKQETQLSEFIKRSETSFSNLEKSIRILSQSDESIAFMNSTQNDLLTMKNGLQQQQSKLSYFMDQYLDNNLEWTTVLRRQDGSVNFYRNWSEYRNGFGNTDSEFFIGLDKLHKLTTLGAPKELLIVLKDENEKRIARYDIFRIGNAEEKYQLLELGTYSGDAGDSLVYHKNKKFSTHDNDNDENENTNCAEKFKGAWWFHTCYRSHLFGQYNEDYGVAWFSWKGLGSGIKFAEMKIRSKFN